MADLSMGAVVLLLGLMPITSARAAPACLGCSARPHGQPFVSSGPPLYYRDARAAHPTTTMAPCTNPQIADPAQ